MRGPRLGKRLGAVLSLVPEAARTVADVGAGHGALGARLAAKAGINVIATEARTGPYAELCRNVSAWHMRDRLDLRQGSGLDVLGSGEVDAVVVAGVSARTALDVCSQAPAKRVRWVVIQCVQGQGEVEPWLNARGWRVLCRVDVRERRRVYPTWLAEVVA